MRVYKKQLKDIWLKAAVAGSLWGSIEIIAGSFFHNIRMPMSGTVLAVLGVSLMVAFGQIWKDKGLFWRAGLIAAVMKSISPSAVLIGPMTGIFLEALLFELAVSFLGRNNVAYFIGSILALYSVVIHKLITLLVIYGLDLVKITENLYFFIVKQLKIENLDFAEALFILSSFYIVLGILSAVSGMLTGKKALKMRDTYNFSDKVKFEEKKDTVSPDYNNGSVLMLLVHIISITGILVVTSFFSLILSSSLVLIYVSFVIIKYKRALRYFKRPGFWIQILIFVLISILFYDGFNRENYFSPEGIDAGFKMGMRAILIVIGFSAISSELRNPLIRILLYRKGFWQFYTALSSAFSVLPYLMKHSAHPKAILKNPAKTLTRNILDAEYVFEKFKKKRNSVYLIVISGKRQEGKTYYVEKLSDILKRRGYKVSGFIAPGKFKGDKRSEFIIKNIQTGESKILCSTDSETGQMKTGQFYFSEEGLNFGKEILSRKNLTDTDFVIVDETGPLELRGKGWSSAIEELLNNEELLTVCTVRESLVYDILRRFGVTDALIFDIGNDDSDKAVENIIKFKNEMPTKSF